MSSLSDLVGLLINKFIKYQMPIVIVSLIEYGFNLIDLEQFVYQSLSVSFLLKKKSFCFQALNMENIMFSIIAILYYCDQKIGKKLLQPIAFMMSTIYVTIDVFFKPNLTLA